jgi:hypothetical protein
VQQIKAEKGYILSQKRGAKKGVYNHITKHITFIFESAE